METGVVEWWLMFFLFYVSKGCGQIRLHAGMITRGTLS